MTEEAEGRNLAPGEQGPDRESERPSKADIQNNANKTCRGCQVTIDSRKLFIKHCQVVHGMRFKTRRGRSLPPPPVPEAQDGGPEPATYAQHSDQEEEAKRAGSSGLPRSSIDELLDVSREDGELQVTRYADRELGETDQLVFSDGGEKGAPRQETREKEDSSGKDSVSKEEGQRSPRRNSH